MAYGSKVVPVEDAVAVIRPGDTVATSGFVGVGTPDAVIAALEARFVESRHAPGSDPRVRRGAWRRARQGPEPACQGGAGAARDRRAFRPRAEDLADGHGRRHRGLQPAARLHLPALPRDRRPQGGPDLEGRPANLRRSARRRWQAQRSDDGGSRRAAVDRGRTVDVLQGVPDPGRDPARHDRRPRGQHHHGARGADPRQPRDRHGGQELEGPGDRAGGAACGLRIPEPACM